MEYHGTSTMRTGVGNTCVYRVCGFVRGFIGDAVHQCRPQPLPLLSVLADRGQGVIQHRVVRAFVGKPC